MPYHNLLSLRDIKKIKFRSTLKMNYLLYYHYVLLLSLNYVPEVVVHEICLKWFVKLANIFGIFAY